MDGLTLYRVQSKQQLESKLYEWGEEVGSNTIEVHIHHLRKKFPKEFIKIMTSLADITEKPHEDNLMALPEDPNDEVVANAQLHLANFYLYKILKK